MIKELINLKIICDKAPDFIFDIEDTTDVVGATLDIRSCDVVVVTIYLNKTFNRRIIKDRFIFKWSDIISMNYTTTDVLAEVKND